MRVFHVSPQVVGYRSRLNSTLYRENAVHKLEILDILKALRDSFANQSYHPYYDRDQVANLYKEQVLKEFHNVTYYPNGPATPLLWQDFVGNLNASSRSLRSMLVHRKKQKGHTQEIS